MTTTYDFASMGEARPTLTSGRFVIELQAGSWQATTNRGGTFIGLSFKITEGPQAGREVRIRFVIQPKMDGFRDAWERDREVLAQWAAGVGAKGGATLDAAMEQLWRASRGRRVVAALAVTKDQRGLSTVEITAIKIEPQPEKTVSETALVPVSKDQGGTNTSEKEAGDEPVV